MKSLNYLEILKKSLSLTWHNKYLWWFGFFIALGGGRGIGSSFNLNTDEFEAENMGQAGERMISVVRDHLEWIIAAFLILIIITIILTVLRIISQAALIKIVPGIEKGEKSNFKDGMLEGKKYFWKLFSLRITISIIVLILILLLFSPVAFLAISKSFVAAVITGILAVIILIPSIMLISYTAGYASLYIVLSDINVLPAIENGYSLFIKNIWESIVMSLVLFIASIVVSVLSFLSLLIIGIVLILLGAILTILTLGLATIPMIFLGGLVLLLLILLIQSIFMVFHQSSWVLFFEKIAKTKTSEEVVAEKKYTEESVPQPEKASVIKIDK